MKRYIPVVAGVGKRISQSLNAASMTLEVAVKRVLKGRLAQRDEIPEIPTAEADSHDGLPTDVCNRNILPLLSSNF